MRAFFMAGRFTRPTFADGPALWFAAMHPRPHCVLDIEATGFGRHSHPIEIGFVREDGLAWCSLIRPADGWQHWETSAEQIHGITRASLLQHGREVAQVAQLLNRHLAGRTVYCDGWARDYPWLALLYETAGLVPVFKLESVKTLLDDGGLARLDSERQRAFGALGIRRHRASSDAKALQWALQRVQAAG